MMDGFEKLQELGSKKIASATHISVGHIDNILNKEFAKFQKPQFFGFISILEREYKIDLSGLKQEFLFTRAQAEMSQETSFDLTENASKHFDRKKVFYGVASVAAVLLLILLFTLIDLSPNQAQKIEINNTAIDQAKKNLNLEPAHIANVEEAIKESDIESAEYGQETPEENATVLGTEDLLEENATVQEAASIEPAMPLHLRIVPSRELWVGMIDTETHQRKAKVITEPLDLNAEKEWLIVTGYGYLEMECGDTTKKYSETGKLLFLYENGVCYKIDEAEFKARNKGRVW